VAAAIEQPPFGQRFQFGAEPIRCGHDHAAQLHERPPAHFDRAPPRDQ